MALHFKKIFWKNFLSTGNAGTTLLLDRNKTTLVQGPSGAGKSTMIDALCFALYGKPFRDINKPMLVNSVNGKQLEVEVEFETNGKTYRIVRGMKPNRFDIFCDNKMINQDAAIRDYQKVLEQQILMMSFKTFTQIVILGSTSFTPFMQLSAAARREVVEDILDIGIFSTMNMLLKQQIQETKDQQTQNDVDIKTLKTRAEGLKRLVDTLSEKKDERVKELQSSYDSFLVQLANTESELESLKLEISPLEEQVKRIKPVLVSRTDVASEIATFEYALEKSQDRNEFFEKNDHCPTCSQAISDEHKKKMVLELEAEISDLRSTIQNAESRKKLLSDELHELQLLAEDFNNLKSKIKQTETKVDTLHGRLVETKEEIVSVQSESSDIEVPKQELKDTAKKVLLLIDKKKMLAEQRKLQENASLLLKDSGIKTAIIREYLPLINKLLNLYLSELQMDVEFTLDEQFNEIVKSRFRDEFQYGNFSEGEKLRLDIAILLVWRHIAKIKNSANTNLLVVDEVLSGRLDTTNQDIVIEMINRLSDEGTNIFVIAHQDSLADKFRSGIRFEKRGNFSVLV